MICCCNSVASGIVIFFLSSSTLSLSFQFTEANNRKTDTTDNNYGIFGQISACYVDDFSTFYKWKNWKWKAVITNFKNNSYFTSSAVGYPSPDIIPSDVKTFYTN